jgi:hypothetical protein
MADFGTDFAVTFGPTGVPDIDPSFRLVSGRALLIQAIALRLTTPELFYDPAYGQDLRGWLGEGVTTATLARLRAAVAAEALKDERVRRASATATYSDAARTLRVVLALEDAAGPFELVLAVSQAAGVLIERADQP